MGREGVGKGKGRRKKGGWEIIKKKDWRRKVESRIKEVVLLFL